MSDTITTILLVAMIFAAYWLPTIVAAIREMPNVGGIAVVNGLTGWTFIGWIAALVMAGSQNTRR